MTQQLGTRDVLEQVTARLGSLEQGQRQLTEALGQLQSGMTARLDRLQDQIAADRRWLVGMLLLSWLSLMVSIWLKS